MHGVLVALVMATPLAAELIAHCDDSCDQHALDGTCDDGGPNALFSLCSPGTDCSDCELEPHSSVVRPGCCHRPGVFRRLPRQTRLILRRARQLWRCIRAQQALVCRVFVDVERLAFGV